MEEQTQQPPTAPTHPVPKKEVKQFQLSLPVVFFAADDTEFLEAVQLPEQVKVLVDSGQLQRNHAVSLLALIEQTNSDEFVQAALNAIVEFDKEVMKQKTGLILPDTKNKSGLVVPR